MKATIFRLDEKILCWTVNCSTIVVAVQPADTAGYNVTTTIDNEIIDDLTEHYDTEKYAMLVYGITVDIVRNLVKRCDDLYNVIAGIKNERTHA